MSLRTFISRDPFMAGVEIRVGQFDAAGNLTAFALPVQFQQVDPEHCATHSEPMLSVAHHRDSAEFLQNLMDALWKHGIRPAEIGTAGHLAATQKHLEDMRAIAFSQLAIDPPKKEQ